MDITRLIGDDGTIEAITFGDVKLGDGTKTMADHGAITGKSEWLIKSKAATGSIFGALNIGEIFQASGTEKMVVGDSAMLMTPEVMADVSDWNASITAKEIDVSLINDGYEKSRKGKRALEGSIKGIFTTGVTDRPGGLLNQFIKIVTKSKDGTISVANINSRPLFIRGVIRNSKVSGETFEYLFAQIELFGIKLGAASGSKQEYESKFKLTGADPVFYIEENA